MWFLCLDSCTYLHVYIIAKSNLEPYMFLGQQVVEEVLDAQRPGCPPEYFNISLPAGHPDLNNDTVDKFIPLLRSRYDFANTGYSPNSPREQVNNQTVCKFM